MSEILYNDIKPSEGQNIGETAKAVCSKKIRVGNTYFWVAVSCGLCGLKVSGGPINLKRAFKCTVKQMKCQRCGAINDMPKRRKKPSKKNE